MIDTNNRREMNPEEQKRYEGMLAIAERTEVNFEIVKSKYDKTVRELDELLNKENLTRYEREDLLEFRKRMARYAEDELERATVFQRGARPFAEMYRNKVTHIPNTDLYTKPANV